MIIEHGDLWDYEGTHALVIPTNVGWRRDGSNVMGSGVARQAAERYLALPRVYGWHCQRNLDELLFWESEDALLILFPVKPLTRISPKLSWRGPATLAQIEASLRQLVARATVPVALPLVGCGNGDLAEEAVRPLLDRYLAASDQFTLVYRDQ